MMHFDYKNWKFGEDLRAPRGSRALTPKMVSRVESLAEIVLYFSVISLTFRYLTLPVKFGPFPTQEV